MTVGRVGRSVQTFPNGRPSGKLGTMPRASLPNHHNRRVVPTVSDGGELAARFRILVPVALAALVTVAGCSITASARLTDSAHDRAVVRVGYNILGPTMELAEPSTALLARDHCEGLGKTHELIGSRQEVEERGAGEYVFYYACVRTDERFTDRSAVKRTDEDIRELSRPMIETSHAEARRHRQ